MTNHPAGSATGFDLATMNAKLECVSRWIDKSPVPTTGATRMMMHLTEVQDALARATPHYTELADAYAKGCADARALDAATPQHSVTEQALRDGYTGSTMVSDFAGPKITLRYSTTAQADVAHAALCAMIDGQPLASTAATQPEQASALELFKAWKSYPLPVLNNHGQFHQDWLHREFVAFKAGLARAALAIPASTAASEQEAEAVRASLRSIPQDERINLIQGAASEQQAGADEHVSSTLLQSHIDHTARFLYAAPAVATTAADQQGDPMDWPLPCDVKVGNCTIRKGCKLRTLVTRMESLHRMAVAATPKDEEKAAEFWKVVEKIQANQQGAAQAQAGDAKHLPGWERGIATVTLTGHQLREALEFINPDGDADQLDDELTFGIVQHKDDDGKESTGMCCWNDDSDGVLPLDSYPDDRAAMAAPATSGGKA